MSGIVYAVENDLSADEFVSVLSESSLGERRPIGDRECVEGMVRHADLIVTARVNGRLIGVARTVTDFHFAAYLSDLAVSAHVQRGGVGRELVRRTREELGPKCALILLSAPAATEYYPRIGFTKHESAWVLQPGDELR